MNSFPPRGTMTRDHDDHQTLQAAIAFLEEYDDTDELFREGEWESLQLSVDAAKASLVSTQETTPLTAPTMPMAVPIIPPDTVSGSTSPASTTTAGDEALDLPELSVRAFTPKATSSNQSDNVVAPKGPKRVRKRQKDELIYLRCRVNELEDRLARLQQRNAMNPNAPPRVATPPSPAPSNASSVSTASSLTSNEDNDQTIKREKPSAQLASVWEKVAARQYEQRQQAEIENVKLKEMLEEQLRVARALERLLRKRQNGDLLNPNRNGSKRVKWMRNASPVDDAAMFDHTIQSLETQYAEAPTIFADQRFVRRGAIFRDIEVHMNDTDEEMYIEVLDAKILPFEWRATAAAFWEHMTKGSSKHMTSFLREVREQTDDLIAKSFGVEMQAGPMRGAFRGKHCVKRFEEPSRTVIVWTMLAEPMEVSGQFMGGLLLRQQAWIEISPSAEDPTQATQLRARYVMTPDVYDDEAQEQDRKVGAITDFVIHSVHGNLNSSHQMIENLLLEAQMKK